jgi:hypothetical protein
MGIKNMKKIIPIAIVVALVLSGIGAIAIEADENTTLVETNSFMISEPVFSSSGDYVTVDIEPEASVSMNVGEPMLPIITQTFAFKPGTKIIDVQVTYDVKEYTLSEKIAPAPLPVPLRADIASQVSKELVADEEIYTSSESYPAEPYTVSYAFGLWKDQGRSQLVNVKINSQYMPASDLLIVPEEVQVTIEYVEPKPQPITGDTYDMLIITPEQFVTNFDPLIEHKEAMGLSCIVETLEDIYDTYEGRNEPEDIKLALKNAIEEYGITYVLLGGGRMKQKVDWWLPEFRGNNDDGWETGYASDLYYADIYKNNGTEFEDWDSNENGVFGEWIQGVPSSIDIMDFLPDVSVGRIPFHYEFELNIVIDKIIKYETEADDSWFKKAVMIAGDTFPNGNTYYEGEMETGHTGDMLEDDGFTVEKLWTSLDTLTGVPDVVKAISAGAGFVHFAGHGNPSTWSTHPPDDHETWITGLSFTDMHKLRNREKIPFILVGGCHNAQFNATMGYILHGILTLGIQAYFNIPDENDPFLGPFWLKEWVPRDFCSWLLLRNNGGAIGSVGMTSLGYGYIDQHAGAGLGGWIEPRMFDAYANQSIDNMGLAHAQAITDYINIIGDVNVDNIDRKTIEAFVLLGDPSLMLGGYD